MAPRAPADERPWKQSDGSGCVMSSGSVNMKHLKSLVFRLISQRDGRKDPEIGQKRSGPSQYQPSSAAGLLGLRNNWMIFTPRSDP